MNKQKKKGKKLYKENVKTNLGKNPNKGRTDYVQPPDQLPAFPEAKRCPSKTYIGRSQKQRTRWRCQEFIYEWDYRHGCVEIYCRKNGRHRGEFDPMTAQQVKPPNPKYRISP
jgi:hypothetical protein